MRRAALAILAAVVIGGCGNDRTAPPDIGAIPAPKSFRDAVYREDGIEFRAPTNWRIVPGSAPHVATVAVGDGQIGVWRYPRTDPLPETRSQLHAARLSLLAQIERRDPSFEVTSTRLVMKRGLRAVEVVGVGANLTNAGERRSMRSLHAYGHGSEIVLDAFAPPEDFARVDKQTFAPVARSLKLAKPRS